MITKKAELAEKCLYNIKIQERKRDVELKSSEKWDESRRMVNIPQTGTNNDHGLLQIFDKYRTANPDNTFIYASSEDRNLKDSGWV